MSKTKTTKFKTYADRISTRYVPDEIVLEDRYTFKQSTSFDETTGRMVKQLNKVPVNKNPYEHLKPTDFCIENLEAAGVELKPCSLRLSAHETISHIENNLSNLVNNTKSN